MMSNPIIVTTILRPKGDTGVHTHFQSFFNWVASTGNPISIVTPFDSRRWKIYSVSALRRLLEPINGTAAVWWYRHWNTIILRDALRLKLANAKPCVIYAQCPLSAHAALNARTSAEQRVFLVTHFNISQADEWAEKGRIKTNGRLYNTIRKFERKILPAVDAIVFVSDFMRRELISRHPKIVDKKSLVIPNFLPAPLLTPNPEGIIADLICIGTLEPRKNQIFALEVIAASTRLGQPLSLNIVGDGPDRSMLERAAKRLGITEQVNFLGRLPQAASELCKYRAYLHVSKMESFGIVLIEAMSRGLPIFAPAVGGIPEIFTDGNEGRLIPLNDAEISAKIILQLLNSKQLVDRSSNAARNSFFSRFEESKVAPILFEFMQ